MAYNQETYESLKNKAKEHIKKGELKQFETLLSRSTYTHITQAVQWVTPSESPNETPEYYETEVEMPYLYTQDDLKDFLNYAVWRGQKVVVDWLWDLTNSQENLDVFIRNPFRFELLSLQLYAEQNDCPKRLENFEAIFEQLQILQNTITDLENRGYHDDAVAAYQLERTLQKQMLGLVESEESDAVALEQFKLSCSTHIEAAKDSALSKHRGYKELLINLSLAIAGAGVIYLIAATVNLIRTEGKHFFFKFDTTTDTIVDQMDVTIKHV